jgi:K+-sensing histidine kinase KdpD
MSSKIRSTHDHKLIHTMVLVLAIPQMAHAYVDPGSGAMLWQVAAAAAIGSLFYLRKATFWIRSRLGLKSSRSMGYLFASCYALVASILICSVFRSLPVPRFNDIFLIGIVLTTYLFAWDAAAFLLGIAVLVSAWVLPPYGSFGVARMEDWYRIFSFTCVSLFLIVLVHRLKARLPEPASEVSMAPPLKTNSAAAGR